MKTNDPILPIVLILLFGGIAAGLYFWLRTEVRTPPVAVEAPAAPAAPAEPPIRHPIPKVASEAEAMKPLPALADSDDDARAAAAELVGRSALERLFNLTNIVRRFVVTVDDLPRQKLGQRYNLAKPVAGDFLVS